MKMYFTNDEEPVRPGARNRKRATIPPFSLFGPLDISDSGVWTPPQSILVTGCIVRAGKLPPTDDVFASIQIIRLEAFNQETILAAGELAPKSYQTTFRTKIEGPHNLPIISPIAPVFVRSLRASGHENVVVQLIGENM